MRINGRVFVEEDHIGDFTVDSDNQLVVDFNGGRWGTDWVFRWAQEHGKTLVFVPAPIDYEVV